MCGGSDLQRRDLLLDTGLLDVSKVGQLLSRGTDIQDLPLIVAYYARVSTEDEEQLHSLRSQREYYANMIRSNPRWTLWQGYWDEGISGTSTEKREQFNRMLADAAEHRFDLIVTKEISRFARNTVDSLQTVRRLLAQGIGVWFETDGIKTFEPGSEFMLTIMSGVAQEESRKIHERVRRGNQMSIQRHVVLGNDRIYGYRKNKGRLVIQPQEAEMIRDIFDRYANRLEGQRTIARALWEQGRRNFEGGRISETTVRRILENPKYKGFYCGGKTTKPFHLDKRVDPVPKEQWVQFRDDSGQLVPAIVSEAVWDKANARLQARSHPQLPGAPNPYARGCYSYSGKILCAAHRTAYCRSQYRNRRKDGTVTSREVWQCGCYVRQGRSGCDKPALYTSELDSLLLALLDRLFPQPESLAQQLLRLCLRAARGPGREGPAAELKQQLDQLERRKSRAFDKLLEGIITDDYYRGKASGFDREIREIQTRLAALKTEEKAQNDLALHREELLRQIRAALTFPEGLTRGLTDALIGRILVQPESGGREVSLLLELPEKLGQIPCGYIRNRGQSVPSICPRSEV